MPPNRYLHIKLFDQMAVRPFAAPDALGLVDLLYRAHGFTWRGAERAYDPDALAARLAGPGAAAFVATDVTGRLLGAILLEPAGGAAEAGDLVLEPLALEPGARAAEIGARLVEAARAEALARGAARVCGSVEPRHPFARALAAERLLPLAVEPGAHPPEVTLRGLEAGAARSERGTLLCGGWIFDRRRRPVYLPARHAAIVRELYALHGLEREFRAPSAAGRAANVTSEVEVSVREAWLSARVDVRTAGRDLAERLEAVKRELDAGLIEHVDLRLPLDQPLDLEGVEALGFFFCGIDPAAPGGDRLRLAALARPVDLARVAVEPAAAPLLRYTAGLAPRPRPPRERDRTPAVAPPPPDAGSDAVRRLSAGLAHEINNPLHIILGSAYYLKQRLRDGQAAEAEEHISTIESEVARIAKILAGLERYAAPARDGFTPLDPAQLLEHALAALAPLAEARRVPLATRVGPDLPPVRGERSQLEEAFFQLGKNAIEASPEGRTVTVEARAEGGAVAIAFRDGGPGIDPADLPHVFEPFFTRKDPGAGTGLGLAIARSIVETHGGAVEIESRPGEGTTARIRLPAQDAVALSSKGEIEP
jgi:signal transduction histidine kinase/predicted N-acetyltransferase YhbS